MKEKSKIILPVIIVAIITIVLILLIPVEKKNELYDKYGILAVNAETDEKSAYILENIDQYPDDMLDLYYYDWEMYVDYLYNYPEHKNDYLTMSYTKEELNSETIPALYMEDVRWGYEYITTSRISDNGCAGVALTMAYLHFYHDGNVDPVKVLDKAKSLDALMFDGILSDYITDIAAEFGMNAEGHDCYINQQTGVEHEKLIEVLDDKDAVLLVNMMDEEFGRHFIIVRGYCDEGYYINDPASEEKTARIWDFETIENGTGYYWKLTKS